MEQFYLFRQKWEETIVNINDCSPDISLYIGDFNARNSNWWQNDLTNRQGVEIIDLTSQYNLHQGINKPTHIIPKSASCIDLIFTSANDLSVDSVVYPSLYTRCNHQIVFAKVNFNFFPLLHTNVGYGTSLGRIFRAYDKLYLESIGINQFQTLMSMIELSF